MTHEAIMWRWPNSRLAMQNDVIVLWEGPGPRPTDAEIAQAVTEYQPWYRWHVVRTQRNALLASCDWTQVADAAASAENVAAWVTYRQVLRNVPQTQTDPDAIVWPVPPFVIDPIPV